MRTPGSEVCEAVADAPENFPPGGRFAAAAGGGPQYVAFRDAK